MRATVLQSMRRLYPLKSLRLRKSLRKRPERAPDVGSHRVLAYLGDGFHRSLCRGPHKISARQKTYKDKVRKEGSFFTVLFTLI